MSRALSNSSFSASSVSSVGHSPFCNITFGKSHPQPDVEPTFWTSRFEKYCLIAASAHDGALDLGEEDCRDHLDRLEEGGTFRRQLFKTSSLSACDRESVPSWDHPCGGRRVLETLGSRESINRKSQATVLLKHASLRFYPMPPWITKESHRPRVSNRTMSYRLI